MPLRCDETGLIIKDGDVLMAGTRQDVVFFTALSQQVLGRIPESEKRLTRREPGEGGVDIHQASASGDYGSYVLADFTLGKFAFSISKETAQKYMPQHARRYWAPANP